MRGDFIEGLPKSYAYEIIFPGVDHFTKYGYFIALKRPLTTREVAEIFCREIVWLHGMPRSIVSNRDKLFISKFWQELFRLQKTNLCMSSTYHSQTDGQIEVLNRCLENYLRCFASD